MSRQFCTLRFILATVLSLQRSPRGWNATNINREEMRLCHNCVFWPRLWSFSVVCAIKQHAGLGCQLNRTRVLSKNRPSWLLNFAHLSPVSCPMSESNVVVTVEVLVILGSANPKVLLSLTVGVYLNYSYFSHGFPVLVSIREHVFLHTVPVCVVLNVWDSGKWYNKQYIWIFRKVFQ